jgi:hypothetical protein
VWLDWRIAAVASICLFVVTPLVPRGRHRAFAVIRPFAGETAMVLALYALWQWAATLGATKVEGAEQRGLWIARFQHTLHWPNELSVERLFIQHELIMRAMNLYYLGVHVPALGVFLVWLFVRHRPEYAKWRTTGAILTGVSLAIQLIPVAPPRLLPQLGFVDAAALYHQSVYGPGGIDIAPQVAAMPSVHVGWAVFIALVVIMVSPSRWRWLVLIHPLATVLVVVATANHWWLDGVVAVLLIPLSYVAQVPLTRGANFLRDLVFTRRDTTDRAGAEVACAAVRRQCERPGCAEPAAATYGFDARERVAWLAPLGDGAGSLLCQRHAEGFAVPRGWWLNDRRQDATLFTARSAAEPEDKAAPTRTRRRRRPVVAATPAPEPVDESLPLDAETPPVVIAPVVEPVVVEPVVVAPVVVEHGWARRAASMGDLDGLLDARTPLLARAFRQPGTAGERPPHAAGDAAS